MDWSFTEHLLPGRAILPTCVPSCFLWLGGVGVGRGGGVILSVPALFQSLNQLPSFLRSLPLLLVRLDLSVSLTTKTLLLLFRENICFYSYF